MTPIKRGQLYEYGVQVKTHERSSDVDTNPQYARNDSSWPRQYPGDHFIDKLGVSTFEEYLEKNPENLTTNRIIWFYEVNRQTGGKQCVHSGNLTVLPKPSTPTPEPLSDPSSSPVVQPPSWPNSNYNGEHGNDPSRHVRPSDFAERDPVRQRILQLSEEVLDLRGRLSERDNEINALKRTIDDWQRKALEAERQTIQAQANLEVERKTREGEINAIRQEYESKIDYMTKKHADELEIMRERAQAAALKQYQEESLGDDDDLSKGERMLEKLSDLAPMIQPIMTPLLNFIDAGLRHYASKWGTSAPQIPPAVTPAPAGPPPSTQVPTFDDIPGVTS